MGISIILNLLIQEQVMSLIYLYLSVILFFIYVILNFC